MSYDIKFKQRAVEYQREGHTYKETCLNRIKYVKNNVL